MAAFHSASPPHSGQGYLRSAVISAMSRRAAGIKLGQWARNSSSAALVIRNWLPILRPFSSPLSTAAMTSETSTPSRSATCSGVNTSGPPATAGAAPESGGGAPGSGGGHAGCCGWRHVAHHLLCHGETHGHLSRRPGRAATLGEALAHLIFHVVVQIADDAHARTLVDGLLDFRRHGDVFENEARHFEAVLSGHLRIDGRHQCLAQLAVAAGHIESRDLGGGQCIAERADHPRAHRIGKLVDDGNSDPSQRPLSGRAEDLPP